MENEEELFIKKDETGMYRPVSKEEQLEAIQGDHLEVSPQESRKLWLYMTLAGGGHGLFTSLMINLLSKDPIDTRGLAAVSTLLIMGGIVNYLYGNWKDKKSGVYLLTDTPYFQEIDEVMTQAYKGR